MDEAKKKRPSNAGWRTGSVAEFLHLTKEEESLVEMKVRLSKLVRDSRKQRGMSQTTLARRLRSSQSRVAKIEAADPSVSLDLLLRASFATGATRKDLARAIA